MNGGKHNHRSVNTPYQDTFLIKILVLILLSSISVIGCNREEEETPTDEKIPIQQLETFTTQHKEAGVLKWDLVGKSSEFHGTLVTVVSPEVDIYEDGKISITLTSKIGHYYTQGKNKDNLYLEGDVVGVNENGKLYTEKLQWRNKDGTLYSPTEVKIVRGDSTWYGEKMEGNPNLETIKMSNNRFKLFPKDEDINEKQ
ncbi:LPS export ABC transporter periplasmic protein LptC [Candidatus Poribacteria bacterium]|nr:MAG: LPS export ABC transporter periplasmic protein LptC [Candidatus Poribacteria bacterium]